MKINNADIFVETLPGNGNINFVLLHNAGGSHQFFTQPLFKRKLDMDSSNDDGLVKKLSPIDDLWGLSEEQLTKEYKTIIRRVRELQDTNSNDYEKIRESVDEIEKNYDQLFWGSPRRAALGALMAWHHLANDNNYKKIVLQIIPIQGSQSEVVEIKSDARKIKEEGSKPNGKPVSNVYDQLIKIAKNEQKRLVEKYGLIIENDGPMTSQLMRVTWDTTKSFDKNRSEAASRYTQITGILHAMQFNKLNNGSKQKQADDLIAELKEIKKKVENVKAGIKSTSNKPFAFFGKHIITGRGPLEKMIALLDQAIEPKPGIMARIGARLRGGGKGS